MALTHTSYQRDAERALYADLSIYASSDDSLKCMETLATNPEKAALVCFLTVQYTRDEFDNNQKVTTYLSKSLINMHSLSDFRVRSRPGEEAQTKGLDKILWSVYKIQNFLSNDSDDDTVKVIFNYILFTATTTFSTFHKSLRVKRNYRYLDYIPMRVRKSFEKLSKSCRMINYPFQSSLH